MRDRPGAELADDFADCELVESVEFGVRLAALRFLVRDCDPAEDVPLVLSPRPIRLFSRPRVPSVLVPFCGEE